MDKNALKQTTNEGLAHGLINTLANSVNAKCEEKIKSTKKDEYEKLKKRDSEIVKARYINYLGNNERLETSYLKYACDSITQWRFLNNVIYSLPRGLVDIVNGAFKKSKKRSELINKDGLPMQKEESGDKIHEFVGVL